jgi:hypothetical protein
MVAERTARVTMLWPPWLKEAVREQVGHRGLTEFAITAVSDRLYAQYGVSEPGVDLPEGVAAPAAGADDEVSADAATVLDGCPDCHEPLVAGECWSCGP